MKLLCDHMLGSLARWLRFMGYDTAYPRAMADNELIAKARDEDRILLTRDKELGARLSGAIYVRSDDLDEQVRELADDLQLSVIDPLSRCSVCNTPIVPASTDEVREAVPEGVLSRHDAFWRCPTCGRVYWKGTHWDKMIERLNSFKLQ